MSQESRPRLIETDLIEPNPENPRLIFDPVQMDALLESIKELGILVPLIVFPKADGKFVLLDGERRWRCAKRLNLRQVPANVISRPSVVENILRMFNIHKVRESWQLMPTALKLKKIMDYLHVTSEVGLAELTGMSRAEVRRSKMLLTFPEEQQDEVTKGDLKADFLIEMYPVLRSIRRTLPEVYESRGQVGLVKSFLEMQETGQMKAVTDFRKLAKILAAEKKGIAKQRITETFERLFTDSRFTFDDAYEECVGVAYQTSSLSRKITSLLKEFHSMKIDNATLGHEKALLKSIRELRDELNKWLETAE